MRRKPSGGGYNNQHRKPRYQQGGGGSPGNSYNNRGPRRNWPQAREKYLAQARDAMAGGDRVLAENYLQHADHCYRMMMEEGSHRPRQQAATQGSGEGEAQPSENVMSDDINPSSSNALPAFITATYEQPKQATVDPATVQNWEERDA